MIDRHDWDTAALRDGIGVAALGAVPFGVVARLITDRTSGAWVALFAIAVLVSLVLGAGVAAWRQRVGRPLSHGIVTALVTFAVVQAVGLARRAIAGHDIHWRLVASSGLLSLMAGTFGGVLGMFLQAQGVHSRGTSHE
jgi:hypothetical protein